MNSPFQIETIYIDDLATYMFSRTNVFGFKADEKLV